MVVILSVEAGAPSSSCGEEYEKRACRCEMALLDAPKRAREPGFEAIEICANAELDAGNTEYAESVRKGCDAYIKSLPLSKKHD